MKKTLIAVDSASSFTKEEAKELGIAILPLTVIIEKDTYQDGVDINTKMVYDSLRQNKNVSTSLVSIGYIEEMYRKWDEEYDEIYVFTVSKNLSGNYNGLRLVAEQLNMSKVHVVDCNNLVGIQQSVVLKAVEMLRNDVPLSMIENEVNRITDRSNTIIIPESLDQLKKSGRISPAAAMMGSLLKIKPILKLVNKGQTIDKYGIAKSDKKVNDVLISEIEALDLADHELMVYLLHADNRKRIEEVEILIKNSYPNSSIKIIDLPPVLAAHAGLGCIVMQVCQK